jgi:tetratricopeptide (TPR) repeat protein/S1-C subfamily serine protease
MNANQLSTLILTIFLLPLTLQIRADAVQNRSDIAIDRQYGNKLFPTRLAQDDPSSPGLTPVEVQKAAQQITVRVTSANSGGSGVLIAKKGTTYLVLTNRHVAGRDRQFQIQTPDGQKHTAKPVANTGFDPKYDIALLQFTSDKQYQLADLNNGSTLAEDRTIYSVGYPFDSNKTRISIGKVSQLSDVPLDDGTQIGYTIDNNSQEIKQGMSGGPIVDGRGVLLGINTIGSNPIIPSYAYFDGSKPDAKRAAKYQQANWGVPVYNFLTQLDANILYNYDNFPKVQRQVTPTGYMAKLNRETRQQTVRIETASAGSGSGVIVAKQGNTYYVLTAKHVVETQPTDKQSKQLHTGIKVITYDQQSYQIQPSEIKLAEGLDLAIVKFTSQANYPVAKLGNYSPSRGSIVFAAGYPDRDRIDSPLWQWQLNPGAIQDKEQGKFTTQDKQSFSNGYDILYSSISYGGMSGGPVFDTEGRVIGIHGKAEGEKRGTTELILGNSLGISIQTFLGISNRLQVPNLLQISNTLPRDLTPTDRSTVIAIRDSIAKPQDENNGEQWLQYGNQLDRIGKYSEAAIAFDKAITKGSQYKLTGNYGKALALIEIDNSQALTAISTAISVVPLSERKVYYYLWKLQSGIFRELGKYDDALRSIDIAIQLEPNDPILLNEKGGLFSNKKQYQDAIVLFDSLINIKPEASYYYNRGIAKSDLRQKQAAITDYDRAIAINPNYSEAYINRGIAKSALEQKQAAIADYDRAIAINPNYSQAYYNRGVAKSALGQKQAAITDYDRAIAINPNFSEAYFNRGVAKSALGQKQEAITDYDRAIAINSNFSEAYINRGIAKYDLRQNQEAITDYDRAIVINPNYSQAYNNRGNAKSDLGQKQAAITDYDRAIAINPNYSEAYYNRAIDKSALGQNQAAITDYDRAIAINPNYSKAYYNRGNAKSALGQKQTAIIDLTKAAELFRQQNRMDLYQKTMELLQKIKE